MCITKDVRPGWWKQIIDFSITRPGPNFHSKSFKILLIFLSESSSLIIDVVISTGDSTNDQIIIDRVSSIDAILKHNKIQINLYTQQDLDNKNIIQFNDKYNFIYFNHCDYSGAKTYEVTFKNLLKNNNLIKKKTVVLANNVMMGGESATDFLMFVRRDARFETKFLVGNLEMTAKDKMLIDGIEKVVLK